MSESRARVDLLVVGGGINGAAIARDAAGRGVSTVLCEQHDLASHTSSASTKLIHGGLRYLEFLDFGLVRKALREREIVLASAPHICRPLQFVLPHDARLRPAWMIRAGLFLYDHLAPRRLLPRSQAVDLRRHAAGEPLDARYERGFIYADGWVDDARLVVLTAMDAAERGASVMTRTRCARLERGAAFWTAHLIEESGSARDIEARAVVNATGPWVDRFLDEATPVSAHARPRQVKGSHIVIRGRFDHAFAYLLQGDDGRVVFAIPYEDDFTLIGTTEENYSGDLATPAIASTEIDYLLATANRYFRRSFARTDVAWTFCGLRPLLANLDDRATGVTRDHVLHLDANGPPLLSVYGGKLTTHRKVAEEVFEQLAPLLGCSEVSWTATSTLPGGDLPGGSFEEFLSGLAATYPWMPRPLLHRLTRAYGTRARRLIGSAQSLQDLGAEVLPGLHAREIVYLRNEEWARTAEDILYRRSKLALHLPPGSVDRLDAWMASRSAVRPAIAAVQ